jgi:cohesin complex subunit SA-1/2
MDSLAVVDSRTVAQDAADRRKSARSIRKPELFAEEHYQGSLLSNGSTKRKRTTNGTFDDGLDEDEDQDSSPEESEGEADEEELREKRRIGRSKTTRKPAPKKARKSNGVDATLAIRSANVQSKAPSKAAKVQEARARKSQANEEGLYGTSISLIYAQTKLTLHSRSIRSRQNRGRYSS